MNLSFDGELEALELANSIEDVYQDMAEAELEGDDFISIDLKEFSDLVDLKALAAHFRSENYDVSLNEDTLVISW